MGGLEKRRWENIARCIVASKDKKNWELLLWLSLFRGSISVLCYVVITHESKVTTINSTIIFVCQVDYNNYTLFQYILPSRHTALVVFHIKMYSIYLLSYLFFIHFYSLIHLCPTCLSHFFVQFLFFFLVFLLSFFLLHSLSFLRGFSIFFPIKYLITTIKIYYNELARSPVNVYHNVFSTQQHNVQ